MKKENAKKARTITMINSLEKADIRNEAYYFLTSEREIQFLKDFLRIYTCVIIIRKSASILFDKEDKNDER